MCCVTPQYIHGKAAWEHALSHLIRYHYILLALQPSVQLFSVYPPFGCSFCKHPPIPCTLLCLCVHIWHNVCQDKFYNLQDFMRTYLATTMCSFWSVCLISFYSVLYFRSHCLILDHSITNLCSGRNRTGTDKKQTRQLFCILHKFNFFLY